MRGVLEIISYCCPTSPLEIPFQCLQPSGHRRGFALAPALQVCPLNLLLCSSQRRPPLVSNVRVRRKYVPVGTCACGEALALFRTFESPLGALELTISILEIPELI